MPTTPWNSASPFSSGPPLSSATCWPTSPTPCLTPGSAMPDGPRGTLGLTGVALIMALAAFCFLGPVFYHTNQVQANIQVTNLPPGRGHPLGTDDNGYDILGRLMIGGQSTLEIGFAVALLATTFGVVWGALSGFTGGLLDAIMMRVVDIALAIPAIFLLIYLASVFRPTIILLILVLSALSWLGPARLVRGGTLSLR